MSINEQLLPVVDSLISGVKSSLETELKQRITDEVVNRLASSELEKLVNDTARKQIVLYLEAADFNKLSQKQAKQQLETAIETIRQNLVSVAHKEITTEITRQLALVDINQSVQRIVKSQIVDLIQLQNFPERSIAHQAIDFDGIRLSGNFVQGGLIKDFASTGIDDRASAIQLTVLDAATVFENSLVAAAADIKGDLVTAGNVTIAGNLTVAGAINTDTDAFRKIVQASQEKVAESLDQELFEQYADIVGRRIHKDGLDLNQITQNGRTVIKDGQLGYHITDSNLQRLGIVRDLQTTGENLLSETLYVTKGRIGINTNEPTSALTVWDQECEVVVEKQKKESAYLGTKRKQSLVLGSAANNNIVLNTDGSVAVSQLNIGSVSMTAAAQSPAHPGNKGELAWNTAPALGTPVGWVCLGGARWAGFGWIE